MHSELEITEEDVVPDCSKVLYRRLRSRTEDKNLKFQSE
jgi:hypothetical protein